MVKGSILGKMKTPMGKTMISILWGLGLACLFFKSCKGRSCITLVAPPQQEVLDKQHKHGDSCYNFSKQESECIEDVVKEIQDGKKK